ncbi:Major Facilitator Superfamily protein [Coccidioides posadasii C735 delta SOWgp]|uniref:Major Facilitator Superfamily protein n=1 Tax=Coccidioides posadasii (strain C735) TaxID=222929 RepID=C5PEK7_COCP7|nr:Major Facilitator Superfamily protein [Coccidioides posadasii C735 delta SOWgp]EER24527.1 Major Facilitator Superfamily protein [Coccidioides posadasii C735 delta SOWgp]|eukprot:XP_003066672.1 Major Facilitator Superfamily protein [Coccidioides posadasii C735 delta SOWgp]
MKQSDPHSVLHSDDGSSRLPARAEDTPSSIGGLTPASSEHGSRDGDTVRNAIGRGQDLKKLQTNIREEREGDTPSSGSAGSATSGILERNEQRFRDERDEEDDLIATYSRSYTAEEERRVVRKFDRRLTLLMAFLYMLSFLDRSNIGNAKIAGLMDDLNLSSSQYEWVLTAFYITYILFEWMTLMYKLVPAHIYIPLCVLGWGLIASFQSLVTSFWALVLLRALLGIFEAGFGPGLPFYLSFFYKREELAFRTGMFLCAAPLATSFAGSLAWFIVWLNKDGPLAPWRALFLYEGFPSVVVASVVWAYIPDRPNKAKYLTPRERKIAKWRLREEQGKSRNHDIRARKFDWREVARTLCDPKAYLTALMFFSCNVAFSSLPVFLPTILNDMGYSRLTSQALSAPPYLFAFIVVLVTASASDRNRSRSPYIILHALLSSLAYLIIALTGVFHSYLPESIHILIRYVCIYPAAAGFFSAITLIITWTMDNQRAKEGKGTGMAILNVIGQCGPLVGTRLYPARDGPWYIRGMALCSMFMVFVAILAFALRVLLQRENARSVKRTINRDGEEEISATGETEGLMASNTSSAALEAGVEKTGDGKFVYII